MRNIIFSAIALSGSLGHTLTFCQLANGSKVRFNEDVLIPARTTSTHITKGRSSLLQYNAKSESRVINAGREFFVVNTGNDGSSDGCYALLAVGAINPPILALRSTSTIEDINRSSGPFEITPTEPIDF